VKEAPVSENTPNRRDLLRSALALLPGAALDWNSLPRAQAADTQPDRFDAVIVGSGLGGLGCAAAFARQGFKALVLEQHDKPGGYATAFRRPGGFVFDVSLHSTTVGERGGVHNLIPGFPEIQDVEFVPHPHLYRAIFPDYDLRVEQKNLPAYIQTLAHHFPEEKAGIQALFDDMSGLAADVMKFSQAGGKPDMRRFSADFPHLFANYNKTWGQMMDAHIQDSKLKAVVSALWGYYGLPPSKLASIYYALPTILYMNEGGYYPRGRSQTISDAMVRFIEAHGGKVLLGTRVEKILTKDGAAYGVMTADKREYKGRVVVSNANAWDTFHGMLEPTADLANLNDYLARMDRFTPSLSSFIVFLGLKRDLVGKANLGDTEVFSETGYDPEAGYRRLLEADMTNPGFGAMFYDNLYKGYSPAGKNTLTLVTLQGFDHWKKYEKDYWAGRKDAYRAEKERMANVLIRQAEEVLLPGLSKAIEVKEIATPLTNVRYTGNYRGAIYGWDQTLDNSNPRRLPHVTPVRNLYLSGAWTSPGGGYGAVLASGVECFGEIMARWS
jgi:all-trans-retinol 13,14-reductase